MVETGYDDFLEIGVFFQEKQHFLYGDLGGGLNWITVSSRAY